jgi:Ser/Thr protein kinase RdoA (MazF antagonist)
MFPTLRSLPAPDALAAYLGPRYGLAFTGCTLLRTLVNDVYLMQADESRYVLKLYRHGGRPVDEILWETGLSAHLLAAGTLVPRVVPLVDGATAGVLDAAEGPRPFTLLEYVDGATPRPPFTDELYAAFGRALADFHDAADNYTSPYSRRAAESAELLDDVVDEIVAVDNTEENLLRSLVGAVRNDVAQYRKATTCHGDVSLDNVLLTNQGLVLLDFDLAGIGPLAADFCGVASTPHWPAFKTGYTTRRPITQEDEAIIPYLQVVARIHNLRFHLVDKPHYRGTDSRHEGWATQELDGLRQAADVLL